VFFVPSRFKRSNRTWAHFQAALALSSLRLKASVPWLAVGLFAVAVLGACRNSATSEHSSASAVPRIVTFNNDIAPILFTHCATCHRPIEAAPANDLAAGGRTAPSTAANAAASAPADVAAAARQDLGPLCVAGAPFSLLDYESARVNAAAIAAATKRRAMPPWLPEAGHGEFVNERRLTDAQIALIQQWVAQGAPEGDAASRPRPPVFADGWQLGTPDLVLALESYTLEAGARDVFRNFVVPVPRTPARYVRAIEFRADNQKVLHHANVALDPARTSRRLDRLDPQPGFTAMPDDEVQNVYGWSPGKVPVLEPADTAWALEDGSDLVVQLHMIATAQPEGLRPQIGLFFSSTPPTRQPITIKLESKSIDIPAGEANYTVEDSYVLPADVDAVSIYPHAHYLAREMRGTATLPDGSVKPLILIRQWDVRWQDQYRYRTPLALPKGTTLSMRFTYDNSEGNRNRRTSPPARVTWGPQSTDEMGALWLEVIPRQPQDARLLQQDYFRRALKTDIDAAELQVRARPQDPSAHNLLAMRLLQAGRASDARAHLDEALRLNGSDAEARSNLGTLLQAEGRLPEAMAQLQQAVRLKPGDDRLRFNLGNVLQAGGRPDDAAREYRRAIELNPENADAHFNLAMLLGPQNRIDEAIGHLRRVIDINPQNADAYRNLAVAFELQGRRAEAIGHLTTALRIQPESQAARQQLARLSGGR
jgi:tetratricopeptide (TPR) repeat protein